MFEILNKYAKIGLDFDDTLIGNKLSQKLVDYVLNNPEKEYHIVTFRTKGWVDEIPYRLESLYNIDFFSTGIIKSIASIPEEIYAKYSIAKTLQYSLEHHYYKNYYGWKAEICKAMEIEVLIDDNKNVKENLDKNGIFFINV